MPTKLNIAQKALIVLRSNSRQGNYTPKLDSADEAICQVMEGFLLDALNRLEAVEGQQTVLLQGHRSLRDTVNKLDTGRHPE